MDYEIIDRNTLILNYINDNLNDKDFIELKKTDGFKQLKRKGLSDHDCYVMIVFLISLIKNNLFNT